MNQILCIVGPTGTGKTSLAVSLSRQVSSVLISADSRQVYRGMDIVTGKDHPAGIKIYGLDLVNPDDDFSVSQWQAAVMPVVQRTWATGKLPIVVGGTGLYLRAVTRGITTAAIPPDSSLRAELNQLSVAELQVRLARLDPAKLSIMNQSDRSNPRRLIRAIEISISPIHPRRFHPIPQSLILGLQYSNYSNNNSIVRQRVIERLKSGALEETRTLLANYSPHLPSFTSLGYRHLIAHLTGELTKDQLIERWTHDELAYSKRQLTWFRKVQDVHWFDPETPDLRPQVESLVKDWYSYH